MIQYLNWYFDVLQQKPFILKTATCHLWLTWLLWSLVLEQWFKASLEQEGPGGGRKGNGCIGARWPPCLKNAFDRRKAVFHFLNSIIKEKKTSLFCHCSCTLRQSAHPSWQYVPGKGEKLGYFQETEWRKICVVLIWCKHKTSYFQIFVWPVLSLGAGEAADGAGSELPPEQMVLGEGLCRGCKPAGSRNGLTGVTCWEWRLIYRI